MMFKEKVTVFVGDIFFEKKITYEGDFGIWKGRLIKEKKKEKKKHDIKSKEKREIVFKDGWWDQIRGLICKVGSNGYLKKIWGMLGDWHASDSWIEFLSKSIWLGENILIPINLKAG